MAQSGRLLMIYRTARRMLTPHQGSSAQAGGTGVPQSGLLLGPSGLRAGWRAFLFVVIVAVALLALDGPLTRLIARGSGISSVGIMPGELRAGLVALRWVDVVLVLLVMRGFAVVERVPMGAYGAPWRLGATRDLALGTLVGIAAVVTVLECLLALGALTLGTPLLSARDALSAGAQWAVALLAVALLEELLFRGYLLAKLSRGIGFWPASTILSLVFAAAHFRNPGETAAGLCAVFLFGMVFSVTIRRSGALWWPIGIHAGWDWAQSFLFGVPDSGTVARGRLFAPVFGGDAWLSGGSAGPEGSVVTLGLLVVMLIVLTRRLDASKFPDLM